MPICNKSKSSILVNTVTAINNGASLPYGSRILRACSIIAKPPEA